MASRTVPSFIPALRGCVNILPDSIERDWAGSGAGWMTASAAMAGENSSELVMHEAIIQKFIYDSCRITDIFIIKTKKLKDHMVLNFARGIAECKLFNCLLLGLCDSSDGR